MPNVTDPSLNLTAQSFGENENTWGDILNQNFSRITQGVTGAVTLSLTGGNVDVSEDNRRNAVLIISGTLTSTQTITVPKNQKTWFVFNNTGGASSVLMRAATDPPILLRRGVWSLVVCDGSSLSVASIGSDKLIGAAVTTAVHSIVLPDLTGYRDIKIKLRSLYVNNIAGLFTLRMSPTNTFNSPVSTDQQYEQTTEFKAFGSTNSSGHAFNVAPITSWKYWGLPCPRLGYVSGDTPISGPASSTPATGLDAEIIIRGFGETGTKTIHAEGAFVSTAAGHSFFRMVGSVRFTSVMTAIEISIDPGTGVFRAGDDIVVEGIN
jgi:hypothetical protein